MKKLFLVATILITSCGKSHNSLNDQTSGSARGTVFPDGSNVKGTYAADIYSLNINLDSSKIGTLAFTRKDDLFSASVLFKTGQKNASHPQGLYTGSRCPNMNDDKNKDSYIDIMEAREAIGKMLIPLDGNIDSQKEGKNQFPIVKSDGSYFYKKSTSFSKMFADLKDTDQDPQDNLAKLGVNEELRLDGRVVLIQGAGALTDLPESIGTDEGVSSRKSLPVGCAILWKTDQIPEAIEREASNENFSL